MKKILLSLALFIGAYSYAQFNCSEYEYELSSFTDDYVELDEESETNLTQGIVWDDPDFLIDLDFDFPFYSFATNQVLVSGDLLGAGVIMNPQALKGDAFITLPAFSDYTDLGYAEFEEGTENGMSDISHVTEGEEGNRIFKLQWQECRVLRGSF